ncbi:MAG TPA: hypothetical protein VKM55_00705 [Candidatus Lokiarchaeia archaeon]|nr:hypothetical protein [Candidatus Lokiarchaeia archaeon]
MSQFISKIDEIIRESTSPDDAACAKATGSCVMMEHAAMAKETK